MSVAIFSVSKKFHLLTVTKVLRWGPDFPLAPPSASQTGCAFYRWSCRCLGVSRQAATWPRRMATHCRADRSVQVGGVPLGSAHKRQWLHAYSWQPRPSLLNDITHVQRARHSAGASSQPCPGDMRGQTPEHPLRTPSSDTPSSRPASPLSPASCTLSQPWHLATCPACRSLQDCRCVLWHKPV